MSKNELDSALQNDASDESPQHPDLFAPQFVNIKNFAIRYAKKSKGNAPTLVLLNGFPQSIRLWERFWLPLSANFDLLALDIPGFGLSKTEESVMSPRQLSEILIHVFDHFDVEKAHLVGPDVGVPIAIATAISNGNRLRSINIFDGPGSYPPKMSPILNMVIKSRLVRWMANGLNKKPVMKTNFRTAVSDGYHQYKPNGRAIEEYYQITHDNQSHRSAISYFASYQQDLPWIDQHLSKIEVPALITWGKLDPFVYVDNATYLSKRIPNNRLVVFDQASHFSSEDAGNDHLENLTEWCLGGYLKC
ncbi:MAG: alpha/beta hydrolase [Pseudomonadota bacterium]